MFGRAIRRQTGFVRFADDALGIDALVHIRARSAPGHGELDDAESPIGLERQRGVAQQRHRLLHLVIRVDDEHGIELADRQLRIVRRAESRLDVVSTGSRAAPAA